MIYTVNSAWCIKYFCGNGDLCDFETALVHYHFIDAHVHLTRNMLKIFV